MEYKVYLRKKSWINDATAFYVKIIEKAIIRIGGSVSYTYNLDDIKKGDIVVAIRPVDAMRVAFKHPKTLINWFQGISPEEQMQFVKGNIIVRTLKYILDTVAEWYVLRKSDYILFVSQSMVDFFRKKYSYKGNNHIIMPCFNEHIHENAFKDEKYQHPKFLYSGGADGWQCLPQTIQLYKKISSRLPDSSLTIYSRNEETVNKLLNKYGVKAEIKYVPFQQLAEEIKDFKYGFLIRQDVAVNNVATPTKMSSYLANGIIPIFTNVIGDFKKELKNLTYSIPLDVNNNGIDKLFELENKKISSKDVMEEYNTIFSRYYSEDYYIEKISKDLLKL